MTQPHPERCETCESFHEKEQSSRYRCSWIYCDVYPKDECPCSPSHWKEASHSSATEPAPERRSIDIAEMLAAVEQARKEEREKVLDAIEKWSDNEVYGVDDEGCDATPVVPYLGLEHTIKSLREGAQ